VKSFIFGRQFRSFLKTNTFRALSLNGCKMAHSVVHYLRNKTSVPVFYRSNKIWVRVWMRMN